MVQKNTVLFDHGECRPSAFLCLVLHVFGIVFVLLDQGNIMEQSQNSHMKAYLTNGPKEYSSAGPWRECRRSAFLRSVLHVFGLVFVFLDPLSYVRFFMCLV
jgi:hypothetical protein